MQIIARSRSCLRLNFVVPLVAVACLSSLARASARMRDPLLVGRRWFGYVSSFMRANGCRLLALVSSGWRRGLVGLGCSGGTSGGTSATSGGATGTSGAGGTSAGGDTML